MTKTKKVTKFDKKLFQYKNNVVNYFAATC